MNLSNQVKKLGAGAYSFSREVGPTCPPLCPFLTGILPDGSIIRPNHRCYAKRIQVMRPNVHKSWSKQNDPNGLDGLADTLLSRDIRLLRLHVGGDFGAPHDPGQIDTQYLAKVLAEVWLARVHGWTGLVWGYTHFWRQLSPKAFAERGITMYASVHSEEEAREATAAGWLLALDAGEVKPASGRRTVHGADALSCPEQVKGHKMVSCTKCKYCAKGKGNVAFFRHA